MNFVSTVTLPVCKIPNQIVLIRLTPHRNSDRFHSCRNFNIFHNNIKSSLICIIILNLHICTWSNHLKRCFPKEYQRSTCQICIGMYLINSSNLLIRNTHIRFPDSVRFLLSCNPANITLICLSIPETVRHPRHPAYLQTSAEPDTDHFCCQQKKPLT